MVASKETVARAADEMVRVIGMAKAQELSDAFLLIEGNKSWMATVYAVWEELHPGRNASVQMHKRRNGK